VGATPEFIESARCGKEPECLKRIDEVCCSFSLFFYNILMICLGLNTWQMPEQDRPHKPLGPDAKERFFWRMGERPAKTEFASLNAEVRNTPPKQTMINYLSYCSAVSLWCRPTSRSGRP
jgi:hypothetical protein